ncbi:MAG: flavodoxin [Butyrivibrio sp.]|nr:flavodoxin [Butyrivibrio sp.]
MSKIAIAYYSRHHGNTKKLLDAIKESDPSVVLIDVTEKHEVDLTKFDIIGFASGIYFGKFSENVVTFARINLPPQKKVFCISTAGNPTSRDFDEIKSVIDEKFCNSLGSFQCPGFDTFGPFKLIGGIKKGHPTDDEVQDGVDFYRRNVKNR